MEDVGIAMSLPPAEARALCQKLFDAYVAEHGAEPRYNEFIRLMLPQGVSRSMARKAASTISERTFLRCSGKALGRSGAAKPRSGRFAP